MKPEFLDNRDGNTLAKGLRAYLEGARATYAKPLSLAIATGYFNAEGFGLVADQLHGLAKVRLLLGAQPDYPPRKRLRMPGEPKGTRLEAEHLKRELKEAEDGLRGDLNLMEFTPESSQAVRRLLGFLASGKIEVRRYEKAFLHGKAFIFAGEAVIAGSSNFTAAGLVSNLELNLGHYQPNVLDKVQRWFDDLWAEAVPFDLAAVFQQRFEEFPPYLVYLRVLWERYGKELMEERDPGTGRIPLTTFQNDGVFRAKRILEEFHGVVVADGVGLGKTFIAGELTVRRTRHFVKRFYPNDRVPGPDGTLIPIRFPRPVVRRIGYALDDVLPGFFGEFAEALMPEHGEPPQELWARLQHTLAAVLLWPRTRPPQRSRESRSRSSRRDRSRSRPRQGREGPGGTSRASARRSPPDPGAGQAGRWSSRLPWSTGSMLNQRVGCRAGLASARAPCGSTSAPWTLTPGR